MELAALLAATDDSVREELRVQPEIVDVGHDLDLTKLPIQARKWHRLDDLVAVVADLENSSQLSVGKHAGSTASIYQAALGSGTQILRQVGADDMDIQGDAVLGFFWGELRLERAMCAAITLKTFSCSTLQPRLDKKWPEAPESGFKVGVASGPTVVKRIGVPRVLDAQEEVWTGRPVNFAAKAAQAVTRGQLLVSASVWDGIEKNDYLTFSCPCGDGPAPLWSEHAIDALPDDEPERAGRLLGSIGWCEVHGEDFCNAVLDGNRRRQDTSDLRVQLDRAAALASKQQVELGRRRALAQRR